MKKRVLSIHLNIDLLTSHHYFINTQERIKKCNKLFALTTTPTPTSVNYELLT